MKQVYFGRYVLVCNLVLGSSDVQMILQKNKLLFDCEKFICALEECKTYSIIHDYPQGNEAENYFVKKLSVYLNHFLEPLNSQ